MRNNFSLVDLSKPHLITLDAARYYVPIYNAVMMRHARGDDIRVPNAEPLEGITPKAIAFDTGSYLSDEFAWTFRSGVATINMRGPVVRYGGFFSSMSGLASLGSFALSITQALSHPSVKAICFNYDSPGGDATSIAETAQTIYEARGTKPMVAYVDGSCCSAAQWLAAGCDEIVISPTGMAGSIGAVIAIEDDSAMMEAMGIKQYVYKSSKSPKKWAPPGTKTGDEQYQMIVDRLGATFGEGMAQLRGVSIEKVWSDFGQGGVLLGQDAVDAGLCDRLGDYESLISELSAGYVPGRRTSFAVGASFGDQNPVMKNQLTLAGILAACGVNLGQAIQVGAVNTEPVQGEPVAPGTFPQAAGVELPPIAPADGRMTQGVSNVGASLASRVVPGLAGGAAAPDPQAAEIARLNAEIARLQGTNQNNAQASFVALAKTKTPTHLHAALGPLFESAEAGTLTGAELHSFFSLMGDQMALQRINPRTGATTDPKVEADEPNDDRPTNEDDPTSDPEEGKPVSASRREQLLNMSALGREVAASKKR